jgi:aspartyl-tRNA(Asn)/glutamyl-tRNA(Gln) amidotransferase subunit A
MTRSVEDAALLFEVLAGHDPRDPASAAVPAPAGLAEAQPSARGLRLGVPRAYFWDEVAPDVRPSLDAALETLTSLGAELVPVDLGDMPTAIAAQQVLSMAEASAYYEPDITTAPETFGSDVRERLEAGLMVSAVDYLRAQRVRRQVTEAMVATLEAVDLLVTPATPIAAAPLAGADSAVLRGSLTRCTSPFNLTGMPALAVPCGFTPAGLPVGLQLVGRHFDEATLLRCGAALEQALALNARPALTG